MKQILAAALILGGIGAIAFLGYRSLGGFAGVAHQDTAALDMQAALDAEDAGQSGRRSKPLVAPTVCDSIRTGVFFDICQSQPDGEQMALPWDIDLNDFEENCILEAFHMTNRQVLQRKQRTYLPDEPSDARVITFACDVAMATFSEGFILDEGPDSSASSALTKFFKERASTNHGPEIFY